MSDTQPTAAQPGPAEEQPTAPPQPAPVAEAAAEPPAPRTRLRDLVFGLRSLVAVAIAGVIVGGLGGFAIHAATDGHDERMGRFGPREGFGGGPGGGFQQGPGGFPQGPGGGFQQGPDGQPGPGQMPGQMGPGPQGQPPSPAPSQPTDPSPTASQDS